MMEIICHETAADRILIRAWERLTQIQTETQVSGVEMKGLMNSSKKES